MLTFLIEVFSYPNTRHESLKRNILLRNCTADGETVPTILADVLIVLIRSDD